MPPIVELELEAVAVCRGVGARSRRRLDQLVAGLVDRRAHRGVVRRHRCDGQPAAGQVDVDVR